MNIYFNIKKTTIMLASLVSLGLLMSGCKDDTIDPDKYIELGQYKGLEVERAVHEVTDEELEDELLTLASSFASEETITSGEVETGDSANIDYCGKKDGVAFDGGTSQGYNLVIGSGTFIPGFEDGLVGVKIGDTVDLDLKFPENYGKAELAGADVVFTVTVNYVTRKDIPEVTDEFIKEISNGQYQDLESYTAALEEEMISEYEEYNQLQYYKDLWQAAVDNATVIKDIPAELISEKTSRMVVNAQQYAISYGISFDDFLKNYMGITKEQFNSQSAEYAKRAAKESLVLAAIAKKEGISVSDEEVEKAAEEYTQLGSYESLDEFKSLANMDDLKEYILQSKVEDFLAENAAK